MRKMRLVLILLAWGILLAVEAMSLVHGEECAARSRTREVAVRSMKPGEAEAGLVEASAANHCLAASGQPFSFRGSCAPDVRYISLLREKEGAAMAELTVPAIGLDLPIFHGTYEETLEKGAGHMYGTSLPTGGMSTHAVLAGHTGIAGNDLFTRLTEMREGDLFLVRVLGRNLWYRVDRIVVVEPRAASRYLQVVPGRDFITLYTCTPFGVNNQRLLVRGSRIPETSPYLKQKVQRRVGRLDLIRGLFLLGFPLLALKMRPRGRSSS
ncbi:MAG: class C sortase [Lachnospiraceae bacterium]|nr:class C sortase [Lachnospiraceae bacterium]